VWPALLAEPLAQIAVQMAEQVELPSDAARIEMHLGALVGRLSTSTPARIAAASSSTRRGARGHRRPPHRGEVHGLVLAPTWAG
jgi:hypothetical protein